MDTSTPSRLGLFAAATLAFYALASPVALADTTCTRHATPEQAKALLDRWFANATYLDFTPLELPTQDGSASQDCLLEVELLADADQPDSRGFFYVLPDGEHGLNGPLYNKRSQPVITTQGQKEKQIQEAIEQATKQLQNTLSEAKARADGVRSQLASETGPLQRQPQSQQETDPALEEKYQLDQPYKALPGMTLKQTLLHELKKAPTVFNVQRPHIDNPAAEIYVLYDSNCPSCKELYGHMDELATTFNLRFHWVPSYLNNRGWVQAAEAIRHIDLSNDAAVEHVRDNFENGPKSDEEVKAIAEAIGDVEPLFERAKASAAFLVRLNKMSPERLGTPLMLMETPNKEVSMIFGAVTEHDEWQRLLTKMNAQ